MTRRSDPDRRCASSAWRIGLALLWGAGMVDPALAGDSGQVEVITSADRSALSLDQAFVRSVFTMRTRTWPDGRPVKVFVLPDDSEEHRRFCNELLRIYPYRLRTGWDRAVFTGTGLLPNTVESREDMEKAIRETPGAIGYRIGGHGR